MTVEHRAHLAEIKINQIKLQGKNKHKKEYKVLLRAKSRTLNGSSACPFEENDGESTEPFPVRDSSSVHL